MGIRVLEIHHHAVRIDSEPPKLEAVQKFYKDVLGLEADPGRPKSQACPVSGSMSERVGKFI
jgi:hypothetical protein